MFKALRFTLHSAAFPRESCRNINIAFRRKASAASTDGKSVTAPELTLQQIVERVHKKVLGDDQQFTLISPSRAHLSSYMVSSQDQLPVRTMQESFQSAILPLSTDLKLQDKYKFFLGDVRIGRILEDMDIFAGWIGHTYILNPKVPEDSATPYILVTVLVDQVDFGDIMPKFDADIRVSGHVSWVGSSSLEIVVWLEQKIQQNWTKLTRALFLMAARDPTLKHSAIVNKLIPGNADEEKILQGGEERKKRRQKASQLSLLKVIPNDEEQQIIHDLFLSSLDINDPSFTRRVLPSGSIWMKETRVSNMIYCHPENKNLHNKVFGGFLMRQASELSWGCGWVLSKYRPKLVHISDMVFHKAVDVSSLIKMRAQIVYSEMQYMQIMVNAEVFDARSGNVSTTNVFHFTYEIPELAPVVVPASYHEAMLYLDGRRHFQKVMCAKSSN